MNQILKPKQTVTTESSGIACEVGNILGGGGQGEVYQAVLAGSPVALKWYYKASATQHQKSALEVLIKNGPPTAKFLWPMDLVSVRGVPGFGYIMPLREPRYKGIVDLMKRRIEPSFRALATAGIELSDSFLKLHSQGLCYRDISFGNVFFEPDTGEVLICDNDNVAIDGEAVGGVLGTPRFMAPEVVRGEARPSSYTDIFSLAILLFYMFMLHHPLEGKKEASIKCMDLAAMNKLYGSEPLFIFDPDDRSNEPVRGIHDNALTFWSIYPTFFCDAFTRAFTDGIKDPYNGRVRESEWRNIMVKLRDSIFYCPSCGSELFYDIDTLKSNKGQPPSCWNCHKQVKLPPRLRVRNNIVMLNHDTILYPHHIDDDRLYDFSKPVALINRNPNNPNKWGLKNLTGEKWVITTPGGKIADIEPNRNVPLATGTKINFGKLEAEIRT